MRKTAEVAAELNKRWEDAFAAWMEKVDDALIKLCAMGHDDLPDWCYADAFEDGRNDFDKIAYEVLEDAGYEEMI